MNGKPHTEPDRVQTAAAAFMGSSVTITPIKAGLFNTSFLIENGTDRAVLRIAPPENAPYLFYERGMMAREPELHRLLRERTTLPVPRVLKADFSRTLIDRDYLILELMPGTTLHSPLPEDGRPEEYVLEQIGRALAELHRITRPNYGYPAGSSPLPPPAPWHRAFPAIWNALIADIRSVDGYSAADAARMEELVAGAAKLFERNTPASLCHMDLWHRNILADNRGTITGIIDWDRAVWGDPEMDFIKLEYCGLLQPALMRGYGTKRDRSPSGKYRSTFYLMYELQKYIFIHRVRRIDPGRVKLFKEKVFALAAELENRGPEPT